MPTYYAGLDPAAIGYLQPGWEYMRQLQQQKAQAQYQTKLMRAEQQKAEQAAIVQAIQEQQRGLAAGLAEQGRLQQYRQLQEEAFRRRQALEQQRAMERMLYANFDLTYDDAAIATTTQELQTMYKRLAQHITEPQIIQPLQLDIQKKQQELRNYTHNPQTFVLRRKQSQEFPEKWTAAGRKPYELFEAAPGMYYMPVRDKSGEWTNEQQREPALSKAGAGLNKVMSRGEWLTKNTQEILDYLETKGIIDPKNTEFNVVADAWYNRYQQNARQGEQGLDPVSRAQQALIEAAELDAEADEIERRYPNQPWETWWGRDRPAYDPESKEDEQAIAALEDAALKRARARRLRAMAGQEGGQAPQGQLPSREMLPDPGDYGAVTGDLASPQGTLPATRLSELDPVLMAREEIQAELKQIARQYMGKEIPPDIAQRYRELKAQLAATGGL